MIQIQIIFLLLGINIINAIVSCPPGTFISSYGNCEYCPPGFYCEPFSVPVLCPIGTFCKKGASFPIDCTISDSITCLKGSFEPHFLT
jgi:hypothetical protein